MEKSDSQQAELQKMDQTSDRQKTHQQHQNANEGKLFRIELYRHIYTQLAV